MKKGDSVSIESSNVWYPAFVAEVWDTADGTYLTLYYATTEWYKAYVEYAEYRPSSDRIVYTTRDGEESEHRCVHMDTEVSFTATELDVLLEQEMMDYDDKTKEKAWQVWCALTYHQKQTMMGGLGNLLKECMESVNA